MLNKKNHLRWAIYLGEMDDGDEFKLKEEPLDASSTANRSSSGERVALR